MSYAIIGFGAVGQALARAFARKGIAVTVASRQSPEALAPQAGAIGPTVVPATLEQAAKADIIILAVPFSEHRKIANLRTDWQGTIVIDATNAYGVPVDDLNGLASSSIIARAFSGGKVVKAFNHLPAGVLAADPAVQGGRRVVFLASDADGATGAVEPLIEQLGFAPIDLGTLEGGGALVQARGHSWTQLIFKDLVSFA